MKVIDHKSQHWYLFEDQKYLYLDMMVDIGFVVRSYLIQLNEEELNSYKETGHTYISELAVDITRSLARKSGGSKYYDRDLSKEFEGKLLPAIKEYGKS